MTTTSPTDVADTTAAPQGPEAYDDARDRRIALGATGLLGELNLAGVLEAADVHTAVRLCEMAASAAGQDGTDPDVVLAVALVVRAVRGGSVCLDLTDLAGDPALADRDWPERQAWCDTLRASPLVSPRDPAPAVLRLDGDRLLYLDRYWREEISVRDDLLARLETAAATDAVVEVDDAALDRVFPAGDYDEQRAAARIALAQPTTVLTGGPGTGKTTTVAALLALLAEQYAAQDRPVPRIALAAPTGKAAARLQQAVEEGVAHLPDPTDRERLEGLRAVTLHRLLGPLPGTSTRFRHRRDNRLPYDMIVVDETSMVSLTMMARLLEAVRPATRLVLVGDPDQLTSVEAGAVLADLVEGLGRREDHRVAALRTSHRFGPEILALAEAIRAGDPEATLAALRAGGEHVRFLETADPEPGGVRPDGAAATAPLPVEAAAAQRLAHHDQLRTLLVDHAERLHTAAVAGRHEEALAALDDLRLLCAHREGPFGVRHWNDLVEQWLGERTGQPLWSSWYAGRPLLVTANDYGLGVYNGDVGVCVAEPDGAPAGVADAAAGRPRLRAHIAATAGSLDLAPSRLAQVDTMHAMTIHKSQGSQARTVVVLLPPPESRLLTRELLYTAITRAREEVVLVGSVAGVVAAVERRAQRATGLRDRLGPRRDGNTDATAPR